MRPFAGATDDATDALRDTFYLDELERQASLFTISFWDAMTAALVTDDPDECWRHLQSSIFAATIVARILAPPIGGQRGWQGVTREEAALIAKKRAVRLRALVGLPDKDQTESPIYLVGKVRNGMEHMDERLDWLTQQAGVIGSLSDWYLSDGRLRIMRSDPGRPRPVPLGMRAFVPTAGMLYFNDEAVNMFMLDLDMLTLRNNVIDGREDLTPRLTGRFIYGDTENGAQILDVIDPEKALRALRAWDAERTRRLGELEQRLRGSGD